MRDLVGETLRGVKVDRVDIGAVGTKSGLYICDPSKHHECNKALCQDRCFFTSNKDAWADIEYIQTHLINLLMGVYGEHEIIIKPKKEKRHLGKRLKQWWTKVWWM